MQRSATRVPRRDAKGRVAPCPGHWCVRVCQEPFPPRTEHHRPRYPSNNLSGAKWEVVNAPLRSTCHGRMVKNRFCSWRCHCYENEIPNPVPTWVDRYGLRVLAYAQGQHPENAGSVKLINVLKLDVVTSCRRWLSVSRRICVLQCSDGSATPG